LLVLVNSALVTRTALFDHQLHNVINQTYSMRWKDLCKRYL